MLCGCALPMGVRQASVYQVYGQLGESALTADNPSAASRMVLARHDLGDLFDGNPGEALARLHEIACRDPRRDQLFALAELNYLRAEQLDRRWLAPRRRGAEEHYLAAAVYAYQFLLGDERTPRPGPFDQQSRAACALYNRALAQGLRDPRLGAGHISLNPGTRALPPGALPVTVTSRSASLVPAAFEQQLAADAFLVRGFAARNRQSGLGAPLMIQLKESASEHRIRWLAATVFLRVNGSLGDWGAGKLTAVLELYSPDDTLRVGEQSVPLETDTTVPIAYALNNRLAWELGKLQFLSSREGLKAGIYAMAPYQPGKIPVLFVHGTMSSPVYWAEMWNTLTADPVLRERFQFWNFTYNSGNPLSVSAGKLRLAINETVAAMDPEARDPALHQMVVIGHSQGGLLARLTVTDTGDRLWRIANDQSLETLKVSEEQRALLRGTFFYQPVPSVSRVVFIATPHRGSYRVSWLARWTARGLIDLPADIVSRSLQLAKLPLRLLPGGDRQTVPTSIDGMSPGNAYLEALAAMPFPPQVRAHSIIAVKQSVPPPDGNDGVVTYASAHLDQVASELVVHSGHSCQSKPATGEEVRRILMEHLAAIKGQGAAR